MNKKTIVQMSRRELLANTGLLASAMTVLSGAGTAAEPKGASSADVGLDYARIRARLDGRPAYWVARGVKYTLSDFEITPVHGYNMLVGIACTVQPDGGQVLRILEAPYATDLATGEVINVFTNPLTGAKVTVPHVKPLNLLYALDRAGNLTIPAGDPRFGKDEFSGFVRGGKGIGADVLLEERFVTRNPAPAGSSEQPVLTELVNYTGLESSLSEDGSFFEEARINLVVFRNGLDGPAMRGYPPMLIAFFEGRKFLSFEAAIREAGETQMERTHPGFLERLAKFA